MRGALICSEGSLEEVTYKVRLEGRMKLAKKMGKGEKDIAGGMKGMCQGLEKKAQGTVVWPDHVLSSLESVLLAFLDFVHVSC